MKFTTVTAGFLFALTANTSPVSPATKNITAKWQNSPGSPATKNITVKWQNSTSAATANNSISTGPEVFHYTYPSAHCRYYDDTDPAKKNRRLYRLNADGFDDVDNFCTRITKYLGDTYYDCRWSRVFSCSLSSKVFRRVDYVLETHADCNAGMVEGGWWEITGNNNGQLVCYPEPDKDKFDRAI